MSSSNDLPEMARDEIGRLGGVHKGVSERTHRTFPRLQAYLSMMLDGELQEYEYNRKLADELCDQFYELRVVKISGQQRSHYIAFLKMGSLGRLAMDDHLKLEFKNGSTLSTTIIHRAPFAPFGHSTLRTPLSHSSDPKSLGGLYLMQPFVEVVDSGKIPKNDHALRNALTKSRPTLVKISPSESTKSFGRIVRSFVKMRQRFNQSPRDRHTKKIVDSLLLTNRNKLAHHSIFDTIADQTVLKKYFHNQSFDETQLKAVKGLFSQQGVIGLIQGPPGAGKTFLIMKIMGAFVKFPKSTPEGPRRHQIMIVSTTNALTSATARKSQEFLNAEMPQCKAYVTRVHAPHTEESLFYDQVDVHAATSDSKSTIDKSSEILPSVLDNLGLDDLTKFDDRSPGATQSRGIIDTRLEDIEFSLAMRMLQVAGIVESDISEHYRFKRFRELLQIRHREKVLTPDLSLELENAFGKVRDAALKKSTVIVLTLSQAADPIVTNNCQPDHIFVDEASRPREPELMAVLAWYNCSITMVGDHLQTPPVVKSGTKNTRFNQLQMSHFERAVQAGIPYTMLTTQHRSDPAISKITSDIWYNSSIINAPEVENRPDSQLAKEFNLTCSRRKRPSIENDKPVRWINVTEAREAENAGPSKFSRIHIKFVINRVVQMLKYGIPSAEIVILCFYEGQWKRYQRVIEKMQTNQDLEQYDTYKIQLVKTDGFQGLQGKHVILEIPNTEAIGFLAEGRRLNTAISRAECSLTIVCNWPSLSRCKCVLECSWWCEDQADKREWLEKVYKKCTAEGLTLSVEDSVESDFVDDDILK